MKPINDVKRRSLLLFSLPCVLLLSTVALAQDSLDKLASDFWQWRAQYQPYSTDDIPRVEHVPGQRRSWSAESVAKQRADLASFNARWKKMDAGKMPMPRQVDYRLMGSALARVHWELDLNRRWQHDPTFYVDQTMTAVLETLLPPPPFDEARSAELIARLRNIPSLIEDAKASLQKPAAPFAKLAIDSLADIRAQLQVVAHDVAPLLSGDHAKELAPTIDQASAALESFRSWLEQRLPAMSASTAVGRDAYEYFLQHVALYPFTPEQLLEMSRQEWARSVVFEQEESQRNKSVAPLKISATIDDQVKRTAEMESAIRDFLGKQEILTVPADFPHYTIRPLPAYLAALAEFGELDDFTGPSRLNQDCVRWTPNPSDKLGYFAVATARDPRPIIVHEGVPGHYMQLWLGWRNPDPIRQHYYDSGANEGLGFYAEEMMQQAGLFEDSPHTREIIYNFMRLRALRVEVDVKLALGEFTLTQAADYLSRSVPMDPKTAGGEAALFATTPGQAISYQIGKLQITMFLAEARLRAGDKFNLKAFNDFVWRNGNVPISLQRAEWFNEMPVDPVGAPKSQKH
jgi:uncharacterized protein (DUF885 family)